jgi:peptidoglycan-associated lipoprotein
MSRMAHSFAVGALIAIVICVPAASAAETQIPARVRVLTKSERIMRWLGPETDVILIVDQGTTLEVLDFDREEDSYWVILPPDLHGTRKVGWIRASAVEPHVASPGSDEASPGSYVTPPASPSEAQRDSAQVQALAAPSTSAPAAAEEKITISVRRDAPAAGAADAAGARSYAFEDVHFERDRFSIRPEDLDRLRVAATALKADPSLVVTIEGHTCSLGTGTYNLALGNRRANAVKDYLVSAGVPADRLVTVSQGERDAEYDNSREETRRRNRRVALVPKVHR